MNPVVAQPRVMIAVVAATNFVTVSNASKEAFKTASLVKTLSVNVLIYGARGTGKKTLARYILPKAVIVDASSFDELMTTISTANEIIISNIENLGNLNLLIDYAKKSNIKIVATCKREKYHELLDELFSLKILLPSLSERLEDIEILINRFVDEANTVFNNNFILNRKSFRPDLSENAISLKKQIYTHILLNNIDEKSLISCIETFLADKLGTNNDYRNNLHIYEVPLIRAGLLKFKSQLKLADRLGLNRNTLRKKISENRKYGL